MCARQHTHWAVVVCCFVSLFAVPALGRGQTADPEGSTPELKKVTQPQSDAAYLSPIEPARARRHLWLALAVAQHGAAGFDAWTTRRAIRRYRELNPLLRPFAHSVALYPVMQLMPLAADWGALRLARSRRGWVRRLWWMPQVGLAAGMIWSGIHNLRLQASEGVQPRALH
jgi:hypothetical protein